VQKKKEFKKAYYFSDKLKERLSQIPYYPLTIVEAPSGFGKTTAVREYLRKELPDATCEWYTCLSEPIFVAWLRICNLFNCVDSESAEEMKRLRIPKMETLFDIENILQNLNCQKETYLVIDNYQLMDCNVHQELISAFSMHKNPNLHMIFITQQLPFHEQLFIHNDNIYLIKAPAFLFDKNSITSLFRMEGLRIKKEELESLSSSSEGWISAIRLQMVNYKETGRFVYSADIEQLVETAVWNRLTPVEKDFLLRVSVLDCFTARQAVSMLDEEFNPNTIETALKASDFIRYTPDNRQFIIHSVLLDYLRSRFYHCQTEEYQSKVYRKAGVSCVIEAKYCSAAEFFYKVKDYDAILSMPLSCEYFYNYQDKYVPEVFEALINECPEETLCKYPFTLLVLGHQTFAAGQYGAYLKICELLKFIIRKGKGFESDEIREIKGEYIYLVSMMDFNDITKMMESQRNAWETLGKPLKIINRKSIYGYASPSILNLYWREVGTLEDTLQKMDEASFTYLKLTGGRGAGAQSILRAEAMLMRGEDDEAEILCYKALYDAKSFGQIGICLSAELVLARIAILRGNEGSYFTAVRNIQGYDKESSNPSIQHMVEYCMSIIGFVLGIKDYIATWFYDMQSIKKTLYAPIVPMAQVLNLWLLLMDKRYNEFYAACRFAMDTSSNMTGNIKFIMPQMYQLIFLAILKRNNGKQLESWKYLREAFDIALPDQIYLPFAQEECMKYFLNELGSTDFTFLITLCERQQKGRDVIRKAILHKKSPLTPREREIALLFKDRMSRKEIADKLYISEETVKSTLKAVYSKLEIHSRRELNTKDF